MPDQPRKTTVEFRYPAKGMALDAPRDRMPPTVYAMEVLNMRRVQRSSTTGIAYSPQAAGGKRGGLALFWTAINSTYCSYLATCKGSDGNTYLFQFHGTGDNVNNAYYGVAVQNTAATLLTFGVNVPDADNMKAAEFGGKLYIVGQKGTTYTQAIINPVGATTITWPMPASLFGTNIGPTGVCFYRASAVLWNRAYGTYFISKVGDPTDFIFNTPPLATSAFAGTASAKAGIPGDLIQEVISSGDDELLFMCVNSCWVMNADPRDGGRMQLLTAETGITNHTLNGQTKYCFDDRGRLYWIGSGGSGVWRRAPGGIPQNITGDHVRPFFQDSNTGTTIYHGIAYDPYRRCIVVTMATAVQNVNGVVFDTDTEQWTTDSYLVADDSVTCTLTNPQRARPDQATPLIGFQGSSGNKGQVCYFSDGQKYDTKYTSFTASNVAIPCRIRFAPVELESGDIDSMCEELSAVLGNGSGACSWYWLVADSAEQVAIVATSAAVASGSFADPGMNRTVSIRQTGGAHQLVIEQSSATLELTIEKFRARFGARGKGRT